MLPNATEVVFNGSTLVVCTPLARALPLQQPQPDALPDAAYVDACAAPQQFSIVCNDSCAWDAQVL